MDLTNELPSNESSASSWDSQINDQECINQVVNYYHQTLKQSPEALEYLTKRGLTNSELLTHFKLGYSDRSLGLLLPNKQLKAGKQIRQQLQQVGVYSSSGHEKYRGSITVPVFNEEGEIVDLYGRKIGQRFRKGTPLHTHLSEESLSLFNTEALKASTEIILCGSIIDALTFWNYGYRHVTVFNRLNNSLEPLLEAFEQYGIERVLIAFRNDTEANTAALSIAEKLFNSRVDCFRIQFPLNHDANNFAVKSEHPQDALGELIRKAEWMGVERPTRLSSIENEDTDQEVNQLEQTPSEEDLNDQQSDLLDGLLFDTCEEVLEVDPVEQELPPIDTSSISPVPQVQDNQIKAKVNENEITFNLGNRRYRIRGMHKNLNLDQLRVNVLVHYLTDDDEFNDLELEEPQNKTTILGRPDLGFHVDTFDLYAARHRNSFIKQASLELGLKDSVIKKDIGRILLELEQIQEQQVSNLLEQSSDVKLDTEEELEAMAFLKSDNLQDTILNDFNTIGVVGEESNKLVGYLACVSRLLPKPLAVVIQSTSAAGKSSLMDAVLKFFPKESCVQYSAMTGQSLYYLGETELKNKVLAIAEEEGASQASYALKLLQTDGHLSIASTGKDANSGKLTTQEYYLEGPVAIFFTTTVIDVDEELQNRCIVLTVNESREQTQAIHSIQRHQQTLEGLLSSNTNQCILNKHQNAQRLLKPLAVINPFADQLTFTDYQTRNRRDHLKYLTLINAIALLHQYQRDIKTIHHNNKPVEYIEVQASDIKLANKLCHQVLGRTLDELSPQSRNLLNIIHQHVVNKMNELDLERSEVRMTRKAIRDFAGWGQTQLTVHLKRLVEMEYLMVHQGGRGKSFVYELFYSGEGDKGEAFMMNLIDSNHLDNHA